MALLPVTSYYPLTYLPGLYNTEPITLNPEYVDNLISLGVTDYFSPTQFTTNPLFANVDSFNQNVGLLQTATDSIDKILTLIDDYKDINEPTEEVLQELSSEINNIIQNTTFDGTNVFSQTLNTGDTQLDLSIPVFDPNTYTIEEYEKLLTDKNSELFDALQNLSLNLPFEYPSDTETLYNTIPQNTLTLYNTQYLTPETLQLLLS